MKTLLAIIMVAAFCTQLSCKSTKLKAKSSELLKKERERFAQQEAFRTAIGRHFRQDSTLVFSKTLMWFPRHLRIGPDSSLQADSAFISISRYSRSKSNQVDSFFALEGSRQEKSEKDILATEKKRKEKEKSSSTVLSLTVFPIVLLGVLLAIIIWKRKNRF